MVREAKKQCQGEKKENACDETRVQKERRRKVGRGRERKMTH